MQHLVDEANLTDRFLIDSAATTSEELGSLPYVPAQKKLREKGVPVIAHVARKIRVNEAEDWDYIVCMDDENLWHLDRILGAENMGNVSLLLSYAGEDREVADPWYTNDFEATYRDVDKGCRALLAHIADTYGWALR
jgi:protein-tyrosine phosphatase